MAWSTTSPCKPMELRNDLPILAFETPEAWRAWLHEHHAEAKGVWLRIYKKGSGQPTVSYAEALDEALFLQRFGPRKARSVWSKVNREHIARLTEAGRMQPAGQKCVDEARADGRWEAAYDAQSQLTVPEELLAELAKYPEALAFFEG